MNLTLQSPGSSERSGAVLVVTIWLIAILGLVVFGALKLVAADAQTAAAFRGLAEARVMAESGLQIGLHPAVRPGDEVLRQRLGDERTLTVEVIAEEGKINPNTILTSGDTDPIKRLFLIWGLNPSEAAALTDALADWVDRDELTRANGAEAKAYARPGWPRNRPFQSVEEMAYVRGMNRLEAIRPQWRDSFSVWTWGQVDLYSVEADVLAALSGVPLGKARAAVTLLAGEDGIRYSADDLRFSSLEEALSSLGLPASGWIGDSSSTRRIESVGQVGRYRKGLFLIARDFQILSTGELSSINSETSHAR